MLIFCFYFSLSRLDGKQKRAVDSEPAVKPVAYQRGIPDYDYQIGTLKFLRYSRVAEEKDKESDEASQFQAFSGEGQSLRQPKSRK